MKKSLIKLLSSTIALTLVLASSGAGTAQIDKIKTEDVKADNTVAVVQEVKEENEGTGILSVIEEKLKEEIPVVEVKAEAVAPAAEVAAPKAEVKAEEVAAPEIKVVPAEEVAAPEAEPEAVWNISASESDNVTMAFYSDPTHITDQVSVDYTKGAVYIEGRGAMEESVYRHFMSVEKFVAGLTALFEEEYYGVTVEAVYDETITDVLELDKDIHFYDWETGEELDLTEDMKLNLDPSQFIEYSPAEIYIAEGITNVSDYAFICCADLVDICLPSTIRTIGEYAFQYCANLNWVTIPDGAEIQEGAFSYCHNLERVEFANDILYNGGSKPAGYGYDTYVSRSLSYDEIQILVYGELY